jgi:putative membrane protein
VFSVAWTALAVAPRYREDWLLENLPTFVVVPCLVIGYRRVRFSDRAYLQGTAFLILHAIGSHYTYSEVPFGDWLRDTLHLARNPYDRLVHFSFGLLAFRAVRELAFRRPGAVGRFAEIFLSFAGVALWSLAYELTEWAVAAIVDPAAGTAFLGTQGDVWDSQKDMALACGGALIAALVEWRSPSTGRRR